ncbi:Cell division control protein 2-like protein [Erysiphe neolycopersici]|uniref:cyclin-dependent kinase n=1 Tax=Erysiphe neolycopersici TaxID=212602 RepID=A0A420I514_9PEZI|nr:Cell division control protein 2-like protein [Erysiphe neolycopersici]
MWKLSVSAVERLGNIERMCVKNRAQKKQREDLHKTAILIEKDAFNESASKDAYDSACRAFNSENSCCENFGRGSEPLSSGISIGDYKDCRLISSGFSSDVYRCKTVALKVLKQTNNIEPHNPGLEIKILSSLSHPSVIELIKSFRNSESCLVIVFPYHPLTLSDLFSNQAISKNVLRSIFKDIFSGLKYLHEGGIIHRDIKPSNILLATSNGPAILCDFGTAWHPVLSLPFEQSNRKYLEVGSTAYRAPETLFGNRTYDTSLDLWACGTVLAESLRNPPKPLFQSREAHEDGNQLGLILSMFKTLGTPTTESWPEACAFSTPPFDWYREFPVKHWSVILDGVDNLGIDLVSKLVVWESNLRLTAAKALEHAFFQ